MQTFEAFKEVYCFLVRSNLDQTYVQRIDETIEKGTADKNIRGLIQNVRAFHEMRTTLCGSISSHLSCAALLQDLARARGLEQFDSVPNKSTCFISGETLQKSQGVLLMLNGKTPVTVHHRYKTVLYYFWILAHLSEDIQKKARDWLSTQIWWNRGTVDSIDTCVQRISEYQDCTFPKKIYVKLKGMSQYIQNQLPSLPINPSLTPDV
tara:strand:- start:1273 stop:1896 length:624 start_codon:yes stop_codon:yes gene_type:complete